MMQGMDCGAGIVAVEVISAPLVYCKLTNNKSFMQRILHYRTFLSDL